MAFGVGSELAWSANCGFGGTKHCVCQVVNSSQPSALPFELWLESKKRSSVPSATIVALGAGTLAVLLCAFVGIRAFVKRASDGRVEALDRQDAILARATTRQDMQTLLDQAQGEEEGGFERAAFQGTFLPAFIEGSLEEEFLQYSFNKVRSRPCGTLIPPNLCVHVAPPKPIQPHPPHSTTEPSSSAAAD